MTESAWAMLGVTWTIVIAFTVHYFWKVLKTPLTDEREAQSPRRGQ